MATLRSTLSRIVDLADPKARHAAAIELAKDGQFDIDVMLEAMRGFGSFEAPTIGVGRTRVPLWNGSQCIDTEVHFYVPQIYDRQQPAPLLLMGHGSGGSGAGLTGMWHRIADKLGMVVVAPSEAGRNEGWDFQPASRATALSAIRWARRTFNIDENRIFCSGISRGGHMAWDLALRHPDQFAAIAPMIGSPRLNIAEGQNNLRYLANVAQMPIRDLQGSKDDPALVRNLRLAFERLRALPAKDAQLIEFPELGHSFRFEAVEWDKFFGACRRDSIPTDVVKMFAAKSEPRAYWLQVVEADRSVQENFRIQVSPAVYESWQKKGLHLLGMQEADKRTGRVEARMLAPGRFLVKTQRVRKVRLLLDKRMLAIDQGRVEVKFNGSSRGKTVAADKKVLCAEFVERFDRTFLPIAVVDLP